MLTLLPQVVLPAACQSLFAWIRCLHLIYLQLVYLLVATLVLRWINCLIWICWEGVCWGKSVNEESIALSFYSKLNRKKQNGSCYLCSHAKGISLRISCPLKACVPIIFSVCRSFIWNGGPPAFYADLRLQFMVVIHSGRAVYSTL